MFFYDLHTDLPTSNLSDKQKQCTIENNKKEEFGAINAVYKSNNDLTDAIMIANFLKNLKADIAFEDCCYDSYFIKDGKVLDEKIFSLINILCSFNPKYISLGWNNDNAFIGGCASGGGLTNAGEVAVTFLNENNICIDCAHSNKKSFYQLLEKAKYLLLKEFKEGIIGKVCVERPGVDYGIFRV